MHADNAQALINKLQELPPERQIEVEDFIDFLRQRTAVARAAATVHRASLEFPVERAGAWPMDLGLRREDIYDHDGR
ncbi:MAG: DUF2281 domain-containing protein [Gammaproteobacteria bacterium]|nr:DUF2281 domain-containing protein [Gammaproteobacteria bacterium]